MTQRQVRKTAVIGATLIDGSGRPPVTDSAVVVDGERIDAVSRAETLELDSSTDVIDGRGRFLLPGLIDSHVHVSHSGFVPKPACPPESAYAALVTANNLRSALQSGITTMRDVNSPLGLVMRTAVQRRTIIGPRLFSAGTGICMTGGHGSFGGTPKHEVDGPWAVRKAVRQEARAGVDLIKLTTSHRSDLPEFTQEELNAGVEEAHRLGKKVAIHAASWIGVRMAAVAGVDTIEHGSFVDERSADLMAEKDIVLIPTIWVKNFLAHTLKEEIEDPEKTSKRTPDQHEDLLARFQWFDRCARQLPDTLRLVRSKGIRIAAGTDNVFAVNPFAILHEELRWLAELGLRNMEAITAATRAGAEVLGKADEFGTVSEGKFADLIMVERDPLEDIMALRDVVWVMKEGEIIPLHPEWRRQPIDEPLSLEA